MTTTERETQQSISEWAEATFGPAGSLPRIAARANEEMAELLRGLTFGAEPAALIEEAADVKIVISRLAERMGFDLSQSREIFPTRIAVSTCEEAAGLASIALGRVFYHLAAGKRGFQVHEQLAELSIRLEQVVQFLGGDLADAVDAKMRINRARVWRLDGSGHGYHVKPETAVVP